MHSKPDAQSAVVWQAGPKSDSADSALPLGSDREHDADNTSAQTHFAVRMVIPPRRRGKAIQVVGTDSAARVPEPVREHVIDRVAYLAHGPQHVHVEPFREDLPVASERRVERLRNADGEALDAARESRAIVGLGDEMRMVALHRKVRHPKIVALLSCGERRQYGPIALPAAQTLQPGNEPQCDVD